MNLITKKSVKNSSYGLIESKLNNLVKIKLFTINKKQTVITKSIIVKTEENEKSLTENKYCLIENLQNSEFSIKHVYDKKSLTTLYRVDKEFRRIQDHIDELKKQEETVTVEELRQRSLNKI